MKDVSNCIAIVLHLIFSFWNPIVLFPIPLFKREDISDKVSKLHSQFSVINTSVIFCLDKFEPE